MARTASMFIMLWMLREVASYALLAKLLFWSLRSVGGGMCLISWKREPGTICFVA